MGAARAEQAPRRGRAETGGAGLGQGINGTAHDDKPKLEIPAPEIAIEAKRDDAPAPTVEAPKPAAPPPAPKAEILPPAAKAEPRAPKLSPEDRVRDPQDLLARILAEETSKPIKPSAREKKLEPAPPPIADKAASAPAAKPAEKTELAAAKKIDAPPVAEKVEPAPALIQAGEIVPLQPIAAETMASPRAGRRPVAYALAAAAVIAVVALVVGAYWYTRGDTELAAGTVPVKQAPKAPDKPAPLVVAKPPAPAQKAVQAKPAAAAPKVATVAKPTPAAKPKPETKAKPEIKVAAAPTPAATPTPIATKPAPAPIPPAPPAVTVRKTPDKPQPTVAAKPASPAAVTPKPASPAPAQIAMLTGPLPMPAPVKPSAAETAPIKPAAAPAKPTPTTPLAAGGEPTWQRNAIPAPAFSGEPQIAIVIDDLGLDRNRTERAIALSGPVTLSFLAYASDLPKQTEAARRAGHELIVHVPMEPIARPKYISQSTGGASPAHAELLRRLRWDLSRFTGYVGVNNHMGNRLASDPDATQTVIAELKARGLLFLDSRIDGGGLLSDAAHEGVPTVTRDVLLDDDITAGSVAARLADLEKVARQHGTAIAIGHPHDQTLDALKAWIASLPAKHLQLVPLTAIVRDREQHVAARVD